MLMNLRTYDDFHYTPIIQKCKQNMNKYSEKAVFVSLHKSTRPVRAILFVWLGKAHSTQAPAHGFCREDFSILLYQKPRGLQSGWLLHNETVVARLHAVIA
jgi:hypothetical protein